MLAPTPHLSGYVVNLSSGLTGILETLGQMRSMVKQCRTDPTIRQAATNLIFLTPEKDQASEAEAIFNWVRDNVRYVRDVHDVETLSTPMITLSGRVGDCDDQTVLLASMLEAVGYPTRFVIEGYHSADSYEHVYLETLINGYWVGMDPTENNPMGWTPPGPVSKAVEAI